MPVLQQRASFPECASFKTLLKLAEQPYDLTRPGALTPERIASHVSEGCGFKLLYGTQRIDGPVLDALFALAEECRALEQMEALQDGAVVNIIHGYPSENRPALHTALRDFFDNPRTAPAARSASQQALQQIEKLKLFLAELDREPQFTDLIVIGIGGSELGPKACHRALAHLGQRERRLHYIGNVDPDCAAAVLAKINPANTLVAVVSKSGTTLETSSNEAFLRSVWDQAGLDSVRHFVAVTGEGSPMDNPKRYRAVFNLWDWVGGRYSATSMVGGIPLAFTLGFEAFWEFLRGAHAMDKIALLRDMRANLPLLAALLGIWNHNFLGCPTVALIPYADAMSDFAAHIQQLDMESNGKRIDKQGRAVTFQTGPIIWGQPGTNAQHSFFQLIHQGTAKIPLEMIGFVESQWQRDASFEGTTLQQKLLANLFAQSIALATGQKNDNPNKNFPGNITSTILLAPRLTPFQMGALLAFYEHKVAFQGFIWDINSFDQEGVQLGKLLANNILDAMKTGGYPLGEAFLKFL